MPPRTVEEILANPQLDDVLVVDGKRWRYVGAKNNPMGEWQGAQASGKFHENPKYGEYTSTVGIKKSSTIETGPLVPPRTVEEILANPQLDDVLVVDGKRWRYVGAKNNPMGEWQGAQASGKFHENPKYGEYTSTVGIKRKVENLISTKDNNTDTSPKD